MREEEVTTIDNAQDGPEVPVTVEETPPDCLMCETFLEWLADAWPDDAGETMPEFEPRPAGQALRIHHKQNYPMPFCNYCAQLYMMALSQFHVERQQREGKQPEALQVRQENQIVRPGIVLPGQPGFKMP